MRSIGALTLTAMVAHALVATANAQNRPDFSGSWVLPPVATTAGAAPTAGTTGTGTARATSGDRTRGGDAASAPAGRSGGSGRGNIGGAAFNCGTACTMVQTTKTLTIKRPAPPGGVAPPDVVINLDGTESQVAQAGRDGGPPTSYVVKARWDGNTLVVTRDMGGATIVQTLSRDGAAMAIAHAITLDGVTLPTYKYVKQ